jgi:hypothetical protein
LNLPLPAATQNNYFETRREERSGREPAFASLVFSTTGKKRILSQNQWNLGKVVALFRANVQRPA